VLHPSIHQLCCGTASDPDLILMVGDTAEQESALSLLQCLECKLMVPFVHTLTLLIQTNEERQTTDKTQLIQSAPEMHRFPMRSWIRPMISPRLWDGDEILVTHKWVDGIRSMRSRNSTGRPSRQGMRALGLQLFSGCYLFLHPRDFIGEGGSASCRNTRRQGIGRRKLTPRID
jgi:hypothetical protein